MACSRLVLGWGLVFSVVLAPSAVAKTPIGRTSSTAASSAAANLLPPAEQRAERYVRHALRFDMIGDVAGRDRRRGIEHPHVLVGPAVERRDLQRGRLGDPLIRRRGKPFHEV